MLTCKQVSKALAEHRYYELPWYRKALLFFHIKICGVCGKTNSQIVDFQRGIRSFLHLEEENQFTEIKLSDEMKQKIKMDLEKPN